MVDWVEKDKAPERIVASGISVGKVTCTRALCPYPQLARHTGTCRTETAENFNCGAP